ncbi:hypothetical protein HHKILHMN_00020 [Vibrio phage vB_VpaS_PGA]|nr:hypothetical protein HHKILHMN_00020 [Vibrio phage vB_VpaS_PGA]
MIDANLAIWIKINFTAITLMCLIAFYCRVFCCELHNKARYALGLILIATVLSSALSFIALVWSA